MSEGDDEWTNDGMQEILELGPRLMPETAVAHSAFRPHLQPFPFPFPTPPLASISVHCRQERQPPDLHVVHGGKFSAAGDVSVVVTVRLEY